MTWLASFPVLVHIKNFPAILSQKNLNQRQYENKESLQKAIVQLEDKIDENIP